MIIEEQIFGESAAISDCAFAERPSIFGVAARDPEVARSGPTGDDLRPAEHGARGADERLSVLRFDRLHPVHAGADEERGALGVGVDKRLDVSTGRDGHVGCEHGIELERSRDQRGGLRPR